MVIYVGLQSAPEGWRTLENVGERLGKVAERWRESENIHEALPSVGLELFNFSILSRTFHNFCQFNFGFSTRSPQQVAV